MTVQWIVTVFAGYFNNEKMNILISNLRIHLIPDEYWPLNAKEALRRMTKGLVVFKIRIILNYSKVNIIYQRVALWAIH